MKKKPIKAPKESAARQTKQAAVFRLPASPALQKGLLYGCLMLYAVVLARTAWLCDDAYITFRTVDNFINGFGLRWNIAERVQSYTHPLWMLVLSLCSFATREFYLTPMLLSIALSFAAVFFLARRAGGRVVSAALGVFVLVLSKAFVDYSTSGLENSLTYLILVLFFISSMKGSFDEKHLLQLSVLACLGVLNRMDTGVLFAPTLAYALLRFGRIQGIGIMLAGFIPFFAWELFSLIYYGYLVPNTAFAKMNTGISRAEYLAQGISYFRNSLARDPLTLAAIAYALVMVCARRARRFFGHAAGIMLYLGYTVWIGGDFMSGRFFAAPLVLAVAMLVAENFFLPGRYLAAAAVIVAILGFSVPTATILSGSDYGRDIKSPLDESGITSERQFYFSFTGLINNIALQEKPKANIIEIAKRASRLKTPLFIYGAVGFAGFYLGPAVYFLDYHALGDPLLSHLPMVTEDPLYEEFYEELIGKKCPQKWRIGHFLRNIPKGYMSSVISDANEIKDAGIRAFYDKVRSITRGDIFSRERLRAIAGMNLGEYDHLIAKAREPYKHDTQDYLETFKQHPGIRCMTVLAAAGEEAFFNKEYALGATCLEHLISIEPDKALNWKNLGAAYYMLKDLVKAEKAFTEAVNLDSAAADFYMDLATVKAALGKQQEADALIMEATRRGNPAAIQQVIDRGLEMPEANN